MKLIKSPLNYTGGKFKLLPQILPLFPKEINTFVDLFCGGCDVGVNVEANNIICNDIESHVINLMNDLLNISSEQALSILKNTIEKYKLTKTNTEGFKQIRKDYNEGNQTWDMFYAMITNAFNYQIRFNKKGEYNMPFGKNRSSFNPILEKKFIYFIDRLKEINIKFTNQDFRDFSIDSLTNQDFVYCDTPYLISCATYNENGGWTGNEEKSLYALLDNLNKRKIKFALSNVLEHKGIINTSLKTWSNKYNVHHLNSDYNNCNYHKKNKTKSDEVLITNY